MDAMEQFFTQDIANEGKKVFLHDASGKPTKHYIILLSIDSDAFQMAMIRNERSLLIIRQLETEQEQDQFTKARKLDALCALVADWSFEKPCTPTNVREFLIKSPQIARQIDTLSIDRDFFYAPSASASESSQESK